jgi:hypothetical protein
MRPCGGGKGSRSASCTAGGMSGGGLSPPTDNNWPLSNMLLQDRSCGMEVSMQIKGNAIGWRPALSTMRTAINLKPATALGVAAGNHVVRSVGLFVDESNCPSDHHAELRTVSTQCGNKS